MEQWITLVLVAYSLFRLHKIEKAIKADKHITIAPIAYEEKPEQKEVIQPTKQVDDVITQMEKEFNTIGVIDASFDEDFGI
jgi:hypothetical protein